MERRLRSLHTNVVKQAKQRPASFIAGGFVLLFVLIVLGYLFNWEWTGLAAYFSPTKPKDQEFERAKTLWDWMQLFIIPAVLAIGTVWFTNQQGKKAEHLAAEQRAEAALQSYVDQISDLLLHEKLRASRAGDSVRAVARSRTLTVLRNLDPHRKVVLLRFLYDSRLIDYDPKGIDKDRAVVNLLGANLNGVKLDNTSLAEIDLRGAKLRDAHFQHADLTGAGLSGADLQGASFAGAILREAKFSGVKATGSLDQALSRPSMTLKAGTLGDDLPGANLRDADLTGAILDEAQLENAELSGARVSQEQLDKAASWTR